MLVRASLENYRQPTKRLYFLTNNDRTSLNCHLDNPEYCLDFSHQATLPDSGIHPTAVFYDLFGPDFFFFLDTYSKCPLYNFFI